MEKSRYRELKSYAALFVLTAFLVWLFVLRFGLFGAKVDWISQHSVLPDYFRKQFYETGELFPEFALNIGGGQNIYHFAYYGLYSPLILFSYLLPFVKMSDYMMAVQFFCLVASVALLYGWLRRRKPGEKISFFTAVIFLLSGPMIYHSWHQIMFVNYMPFLCMGFWGVDRYFDEQKTKGKRGFRCFGMLGISIFLMIMTSFYFSIGGMLALALYGMHRYLYNLEREGTGLELKKFVKEGVRFAVPFLLAVMLGGVLLIPTVSALAGRGGGAPGISAVDLVLPDVSSGRFFYSPYGIGLTMLGLTALVSMLFSRKCYERVLAWGCTVILTVPVFAYLMNGGLYIRDKVMIPFLPLLCYILACYVKNMEEERETRAGAWGRLFPCLACILFVCIEWVRGSCGKYQELLILDGAVMLLCFFLFQREQRRKCYSKKNVLILLLPPIIFLAVCGLGLNAEAGGAVEREFYRDITDTDIEKLVKEAAEKGKGFYRTEQTGTDEENAANLNRIWDMGQYISSIYSSSYNKNYQEFRQASFQVEEPYRNFLMQPPLHNPLYQDFMGVRYLISKEEPTGYRLVESRQGWKLYENENVLPIAYGTDKVMGKKEYQTLTFPYNQLALREYAVVEKTSDEKDFRFSPETGIKSSVKEVPVEFPEKISAERKEEFLINLTDANRKEDAERDGRDERQKVLFLQFHVKNLKPSKDVEIYVSGIRNKLTSDKHFYYNENTEFTYAALLKKGQAQVPVIFGKGEYELSDVKCFVGTLSEEKDRLCQAEFRVDRERTKGSVIAGNIEMEKQGYFITSIPYDGNFEIQVDGKAVEKERVNTAFLGFKIKKGEHEIQITYHAPGVRAGKLLSLAGMMMIAVMFAAEKLSGIIYFF